MQGISMQCRGIEDALLHAVWPRQAVAARHAATCGYARQWLIAAAPPAMPSERTAEWTVW